MSIRKNLLLTGALALVVMLSAVVNAGAANRKVMNLDGTWHIAQGEMDKVPAKFESEVPVPGLVDMAKPAFKDVGVKSELRKAFWHRRTFSLKGKLPETAVLKVHKAKYNTLVILNGKTVGAHIPSFTPALLDVKPFLNDNGAENELIIRVGADPSAVPEGYTFGHDHEKIRYHPGIYDSVELILTGKPYIVNIQTVPNIKTSQVRVVVELANGVAGSKRKLKAVVREAKSGKKAGSSKGLTALLDADGKAKLDFTIPIKGCRLWSPEDPFLYNLELDSGSDTKSTRFGMRSFRMDPETQRAYLNGKPYYLRGSNVCIFRFFEDSERGDRPWDKEWVRRLHRQFKGMHWNMLRYCIGFPPEIWYEVADEEGVLIQDEYPQWSHTASAENMKTVFTEWMRERWNHPCVVIWDSQNETRSVATTKGIQSVRHLDLSNRPWDNGWSETLKDTDCWEGHPYLYINYCFGNSRPLFKLSHLENIPDKCWIIGDEGKVNAPQIVNEYAWLWLNRDGTTTTLTDNLYNQHLGGSSTTEQRREFFTRHLAALTEYWRSRRTLAGLLHFCGLGYSRSGEPRGQTSDHFTNLETLEFEPKFYEYVRDSFSPVGLCIDYWKDELPLGSGKQRIPVIAINDLEISWKGKLSLRLMDGESKLWEKSTKLELEAYGAKTSNFDVPMPAGSGKYVLIGELDNVDGKIIRSLRDINVVRGSLAKGKLATASSEAYPDKGEFKASHVTDGDLSTRWSSEFSDPQWIQIDLGTPAMIDTIELSWEAAAAKSHGVDVSTDGNTWKEVYSTTDGKGGNETINIKPVNARHLRLRCLKRATTFGYSLWEFKVFGQ